MSVESLSLEILEDDGDIINCKNPEKHKHKLFNPKIFINPEMELALTKKSSSGNIVLSPNGDRGEFTTSLKNIHPALTYWSGKNKYQES